MDSKLNFIDRNNATQGSYGLSNHIFPNQSSGIPIAGNNSFQEARGFVQPSLNRLPIPPPRARTTEYSNPYSYGGSQGFGSYPYGGSNTYGGSNYLSPYNRPVNSFGYSPYSYGTPYNSFQTPQSSFLQEAHENSRDAFAGIESIVSTVGSFNMMIESTYTALQSSFNAVLSVVDNFSRLKNHFGHILSALTIVRTCQWLLRKLLFLIGLRARDPTTESAWRAAATSSEVTTPQGRSSWAIFSFMVTVYAMPFLMWKFLSSVFKKNDPTASDWTTIQNNQYNAVALYSYQAQRPDELSFTAGDTLKLAPMKLQTDKSWPLAFNGTSVGIIPVNYIQIKLNSNFQSPTTLNQPNSANEETNNLLESTCKSASSESLPTVHKKATDQCNDSTEFSSKLPSTA